MFLPLEGLDWLWGSGLKKKLGLDLGPGWPFKIIGNFFDFPLLLLVFWLIKAGLFLSCGASTWHGQTQPTILNFT